MAYQIYHHSLEQIISEIEHYISLKYMVIPTNEVKFDFYNNLIPVDRENLRTSIEVRHLMGDKPYHLAVQVYQMKKETFELNMYFTHN